MKAGRDMSDLWNSLTALELLRFRLDVLAAILGVLTAALIITSRWPVAQRISTLQARDKARLQARLATAEESTTRLQAELSLTRDEARVVERGLQEQLRETQSQAVEASRRASQLEAAARPRALSAEQERRLVAALSRCSGAKVAFAIPAGAEEPMNFAQQLHRSFVTAGWRSEGVVHAALAGAPRGVILRIGDPKAPHPCALLVQDALAAVGVDAPAEVVEGQGLDTLPILVAYKP